MPHRHEYADVTCNFKQEIVIPKELSDILETYDEDDFNLVITKANFESTNLKFDIKLILPGYSDKGDLVRRWTIETKHYRKSKLFFEYSSRLEISVDHPLLWEFSDIQSALYFNGQCSNSDKLFIDLYKKHRSIFNDFISFEDSINRADYFTDLMNSNNGLIAQGSNKLLKEYAILLKKYNLKYSFVGDRMPSYWDGEKHVIETGNAKSLLIDNSFVIADDFQFMSID